jgi:hypothetical protein
MKHFQTRDDWFGLQTVFSTTQPDHLYPDTCDSAITEMEMLPRFTNYGGFAPILL